MITLGVKDLKKSTAFYENKFGWKKSATSNENITFFLLNGINLSLFGREALAEDATVNSTGSGFKAVTLAYNARSEKEVDRIIDQLRERDVKIVKDPSKVFWGGYSSYVSDIDGNLWEIAYNPYLELDKDGNIVES